MRRALVHSCLGNNRLVRSSSPPSRAQTEISRLVANSPELAGIRLRISLCRLSIGFRGPFRRLCLCLAKSRFPTVVTSIGGEKLFGDGSTRFDPEKCSTAIDRIALSLPRVGCCARGEWPCCRVWASISGHVLTRAKNSVALQRESCERAPQGEQRAVFRLMWQEPL